jgi:hypothetical protein
MTKPLSFNFSSTIITVLFACAAIPAFANHGGGGGGGFHGGGGGGFHGGGGGGGARPSGGGGGYRGGYSAPQAGYGAPRSSSSSGMRSGSAYAARPGGNYSRPGGNYAGGNQRPGNSAPPAVADGQWHSFGGQTGARGATGSKSAAGPSGNNGWHVQSGNRAPGSTGAGRSFSGQGGEVWEDSGGARNVVSRSQSLSTLHNSFSSSLNAGSGFRSNSGLSASSHIASGSSLAGNRGFAGGVNSASSLQLRSGFGRSGFPGNGFGRGCFNCGFGWRGGWGWGYGWGGWPWLGFGLWDPFWFDPWWGWGAPAYGYGYYPPPGYGVYGSPDSGYYGPDDNSAPPPQQDNQSDENYGGGPTNGNWVTPNGPSPAYTPNSGGIAVPVLIYMKNGAVLSVRDYWMIDGDLHYIQTNGMQRTVSLESVDLPRTNTENAKSGVKFIFKSEPSVTAPAPDGNGAQPVEPNSDKPVPAPQSVDHT